MYIEVTCREAARVLARGGHVWDSSDKFPCCIELNTPRSWKKARRLRKLERKLAGPWYVDGWYIYQKE